MIERDTLLVVIGDHGMTETGDHGGDSRLELESALFFFSKKPLYGKVKHINTATVYKEVRQINLTPTIALLIGLPIPFSNLGIVIDEMFEKKVEALYANYIQVYYLFYSNMPSALLSYNLKKDQGIYNQLRAIDK